MPHLETIFFYLFALGALVASMMVVIPRNPLYSAIALITDFFCFAALYVLLSAHFMAVVQVLVYGGAIMVLFIFIIMLLNLRDEELGEPAFRFHHVLGFIAGLALCGYMAMATSPLFNDTRIEETRTAVAERQAALDESPDGDAQQLPVMTPSNVPGLFADLNEAGLNAQYQRQLAGWNNGTADPAARKYRRFDPDASFEAPPVLLGQNARGGPRQKPVTWGTVEPISLLLVNRFVVPFELTALLLLAAMVGAVIIAKKRL